MNITGKNNQLKFILVDDDPAAHAYHKIMMIRAGINEKLISESYSVDECLNELKSDFSDDQLVTKHVIIADLSMPIKNGWVLLQELDEMISINFQPDVYLVTNSLDPKDKKRAETFSFVKGFQTKFLKEDFFSEFL